MKSRIESRNFTSQLAGCSGLHLALFLLIAWDAGEHKEPHG